MKKYLIIFGILIIAGISTGYVHAQEPVTAARENETVSNISYIIGFLSFPAAGIYYATTGFAKKFARSLAGEKTAIDYGKMGRTTLLGVIVGVIAFVFTAYNGEAIHVLTLQQFLTQIAVNLAAVMTVDRLVLGGYAKPKPETNSKVTHSTGGGTTTLES